MKRYAQVKIKVEKGTNEKKPKGKTEENMYGVDKQDRAKKRQREEIKEGTNGLKKRVEEVNKRGWTPTPTSLKNVRVLGKEDEEFL